MAYISQITPLSSNTPLDIKAKALNVNSTDNAVIRFDGENGVPQNSGVIIDDNNNLTTTGTLSTNNLIVNNNVSLNGETTADSLTAGNIQVNGSANFVNSPTAPTPAASSNDTKVATTEFVKSAIASGTAGSVAWNNITGKPSTFTPPLAANGTRGGIQIGYTSDNANRNYAVQLSSEKAYVNVPLVSKDNAGLAPKGAAVSSQSQTTKFLREDGTWAAPSYTVNTDNDTKVTQGATTTTSWRKVLLNGGFDNVQSAWNSDVTGVTDQVYQAKEISVQPSTGTLAATKFQGDGFAITNLNASNIASGTLSADRLATSGATAGSYGDSAAQTPGYGSTFKVPYITVDNKGRVTGISEHTVKIPASDNTDTLVKQTAKTDSVEYKILTTISASPTSGDAAEAGYGANLAYNPSLNRLSTGNIALTGNLNVTGNATLSNETNITSATIGSLQVNGNANFVQIPTAPTPASTSNDTSLATTEFVKTSVAGLSGAMHFRGITTTAMSDGLTTAAVTINGSSYTPSAGDVIIYSDSEYVWTGSAWERFGRDGSWKTTQSAVDSGTAITNKWVSRIQQNANGEITATMATLDTSGTWSGTATTATKLSNTAKIGDTNKPVYFTASGAPAAINYTIDKSVPSNAVFTDRYVNSASFEHDTTNDNIKMTLTRAGSDTETIIANIPAATSISSGIVTTTEQTFSGDKAFNGSVDLFGETFADSLTAGNLQVNGSAAFVNTIQGNITTATKLQTTRTIWGQSFDGSANISGNMVDVGPQLRLPDSEIGFSFITSEGAAACGKFDKILLSDNYNQGDLTNYRLYVNNGKTYLNNITASSTSNTSSQLIISNSSNGNVALELWRNAYASWQLANESGILYLRNNWTTSKQATYSQDGLIIDYNTGNTAIAGSLSIGQTTRNTSYKLYVNGISYFNGNTTHNGIDYFANGTTYYINNSGTANLNAGAFAGILTINNITDSSYSKDTTAAVVVKGGISVEKKVSAKEVRIDNNQSSKGVSLQYDETLEVLNFIFS